MSTLKVGNLQHPDSNTISILLNSAGAIVANNNMSVVGNLGIGTSSPADKLHVVGGTRTTNIRMEQNYPGISFFSTTGTANARAFRVEVGDGKFYIVGQNDAGTTTTYPVYISHAGNVGIGTGDPTSRLEVRGGDGTGGISGPTSNTWAAKIIMNKDNPEFNGLSVQARWGITNGIIFEAARGWNGSSAGYFPALSVNGSGHVRTPYQPSFRVYRSNNTAVSGVVLFDGSSHNIGGHYNSSTGRFTAPVAGSYLFTVTNGNAGSTTRIVDIRLNGNNISRSEFAVITYGYIWSTSTVVVYMNANDYIDVNVPSGTANFEYLGGFSGFLIG